MSKARELSKLLSGTLKVGALQAPAGTTAQRPSGQVGQIRYNSETGKNETYDSGGWGAIATPPLITTVSPSTYNGEAGTLFTINGSFFDVGAGVKFITNAGIEYTASVVTRVNASQLTATTPQDFTVAQEPLKVKVINPSGLAYVLESAIDCGGSPTWNTTSGSLLETYEFLTESVVFLSAGDPDAGATVNYSLNTGSLPTGLSLNATSGLISGTLTQTDTLTTYNFTINANDNAGNQTSRAFSITVRPQPAVAIFGNAFNGQHTASNGLALTITSTPGDQSQSGQVTWSNYSGNINTSGLYNSQASKSINDSSSLCKLILTKPTRVYMTRSNSWNPVDTTGWTSSSDTVNYVLATSPSNQLYYKDFAAGVYMLDNDSAMYYAIGTVAPTKVGQQSMVRQTGVVWFSQGYYGVDTSFQYPLGFTVDSFEWITASNVSGARIWMFVMEQDNTTPSKFYLRAGWMFTDPNPGAGYKRMMHVSEASNSIGPLNTKSQFTIPRLNHQASGRYYIGWYSGDPNGGTQPNAAIHANFDDYTAPANGGASCGHTPVDTIPSNGLEVLMTTFPVGRGIKMSAMGF